MFKGWKHATQCQKCQAIEFVEEANYEKALEIALSKENTKSTCCGASIEYIGLRPQNEHILNVPKVEPKPVRIVEETREYEDHTVEVIKAVPVAQAEDEDEEEPVVESVAVVATNIQLGDFIDTKRKMSGRYMTDVVRAVMEEDNDNTQTKLDLLKAEHPSFFQDALKYVPKFLKNKYNLA